MESEAIQRLQKKNVAAALEERLCNDFNLAPIVAQALLSQMRSYLEEYYPTRLEPGQLTYLAVSIGSSAGVRLEECHRVPVKLSLYAADDLLALSQGVGQMRRKRLLRITEEAYEQEGLLSHEDLSVLLGSSLATIKRDVQDLRRQGLHVPTRGQVKDIGKGVSHKVQIVGDYLFGYTFSEIERRRHHSISSIQRYCRDFVRILRLYEKGLELSDIRQATGLSERLIDEYLALYASQASDQDRLQILLADQEKVSATPIQIKRGRLLS